jgi:2-pyrone-4,6-dicarboxylate lactonase
MPADACDTHMHVFGSPNRYPSVADPKYDHPGGSPEEYAAVAAALGIGRMVLVQPSFYGTDNRFLLTALRAAGARARAVVFLPGPAVETRTLDELHERGVRGLRVDFFKLRDRGPVAAECLQLVHTAAALARSVGWHVELYAPGEIVRDLTQHLPELGVPISVNHMGYMRADQGLTDADFRRFVRAVESGPVWVKLTGPYRLADDDGWSRADEMARTLIEAAPERMLWGTDWPHIPDCGLDTGMLLARLAHWCPDESLRTRILVDNPACLYDYA